MASHWSVALAEEGTDWYWAAVTTSPSIDTVAQQAWRRAGLLPFEATVDRSRTGTCL